MPFLDRYTAENPDNSYWFAIGVPDFEPLENYPQDFNWLNYFTSPEEAAAAIANYEKETDLQNQMSGSRDLLGEGSLERPAYQDSTQRNISGDGPVSISRKESLIAKQVCRPMCSSTADGRPYLLLCIELNPYGESRQY